MQSIRKYIGFKENYAIKEFDTKEDAKNYAGYIGTVITLEKNAETIEMKSILNTDVFVIADIENNDPTKTDDVEFIISSQNNNYIIKKLQQPYSVRVSYLAENQVNFECSQWFDSIDELNAYLEEMRTTYKDPYQNRPFVNLMISIVDLRKETFEKLYYGRLDTRQKELEIDTAIIKENKELNELISEYFNMNEKLFTEFKDNLLATIRLYKFRE